MKNTESAAELLIKGLSLLAILLALAHNSQSKQRMEQAQAETSQSFQQTELN